MSSTSHRRSFLKKLGLGVAGLSAASSAAMRALTAETSVVGHLPLSAPATQGVSSAGVLVFLTAARKAGHELHSLMLVRHGHIVAEGWWAPYRAGAVHSLYSLTKSFVSTAVGFAIAEGALKQDDCVVSFFPDRLPHTIGKNLAALRVEHLLTMSVGHAHDPAPITKESDWVKAFLARNVKYPPGSDFNYDDGAAYMLSAIVQEVSKQKVIDYLKPRLFGPLDIRDVTWDTCPLGVNTGGDGMSVTTEAVAKLGQLYLQKGRWNGKQLLPTQWIEQATSSRIQQPATFLSAPGATLGSLKATSDWHQGYGYLFWRCRHNALRGDGAFGQFCIVMPEQDAVVAITSRSANLQGLLDLVWQHLLPALGDQGLKNDATARVQLSRELALLALPLPTGDPTSAVVKKVTGRPFRLEPNVLGAQSVIFEFGDGLCLFHLKQRGNDYAVRCGIGEWVDGVTDIPGTPPELSQFFGNTVPASHSTKIAAAGVWKDRSTFEMQWRYFETPHQDTVICRFEGDHVTIEFLNSIEQAYPSLPRTDVDTRPPLRGEMA